MLFLPWPLTTVRLKSFWLVVSLCIATVISYPLSILSSIHWFILILLATLVIAISGLIRIHTISVLYRVYNRLVRLFSQYAKEWLLFVCFCMMSIAIGKKMASLDQHNVINKNSLWFYRNDEHTMAHNIENQNLVLEMKTQGFSINYAQWTVGSGNWWTLLLLPFLSLIAVFDQEDQTYTIPTNVYTLY